MQILIFTSIKNKPLLQQILDWGATSHIKFQMYFITNLKQIQSLLKQKHDFVITTEKELIPTLKGQTKGLYIKNDWYEGIKNVKY